MKITVNLETQAVIAQPIPLRIKAGAYVPVSIAFTRSFTSVPLPEGAVIEFALKPRNQWTGGLLAYLNAFELADGNIYTGTLNAASASLLAALGLSDSTPLNDIPHFEANAEVTWSVGNQKFRSSTFPLVIETPLTDDIPIPTPDPELYPAPGAIALKSDLANVATTGNYNDLSNKPNLGSAASHNAVDFATAAQGSKADNAVQPGQLAPVAMSGSYGDLLGLPAIPNPQVSSDWNSTAGVAQILNKPALGSASAHEAADFATADQGRKADTAVQPTQLAAFAKSGTYSDLSDKPALGTAARLDAGASNGAATLDAAGKLIQSQVPATIALKTDIPAFASTAESATGVRTDVVMSPLNVTQWFNAKLPGNAGIALLGDNSWGLPDLSAYTGSLAGDGTNVTGVSAIQLNSPSGYSIYDSGGGNWRIDGGINTSWINASFNGDGTNIANVTACQISSPYGYGIYDAGWGNWQVNGGISAGGFSGDGSALYNVTAYQLNSPYGYSIYDSGWGSWQVNGCLNGSFSGDGSGLSNIGYAQNAYGDEYGNEIAYNYVQQWGYYYGLSVGNADWASNSNWASNSDWTNGSNYACNDQWGYTLFGAGNVQWNFFGGSPNPGDVATYDGNYWSPSPGNPVPITVDDAAGRFGSSGLRTGWLVKQLNNRTVYQVLDPNDCATELGWVSVGPFILVPSNSTPLVIDNMSPTTGATIHCTAGTWSDSPTSYSYQWNRNGSPIAGATSLTYTVVAADDGANLQCVVSATNSAGTGTDSAAIPLIVLNPPVNTVAPTITPTGTPNVGDTLALTSGIWTGYGYTTTYQWKRAGAAISGATAATYTLASADAGQAISCTITRTNIRGSASVTSAATPAISNLVAVNTAAPTLVGVNLYTGAVASCSPGSWNYHPTSYSYQWRRSGTAISGATGSTYTVVAADVGKTISCAVAAINPGGTSSAVASAESWVVTASATTPIRGALADSSLIAHWPLNEASGTRCDVTSNGINLTPYNNGGIITNAAGKFGMAANIPARSLFAVTDNRLYNAKTICGWFNLAQANNSYQRLLFASLQIYPGSSGISWDPSHYSTGIVPTPGQWYFVCAVLTGTTLKIWVNTQSFVAQTGVSSILSTSWFEIADANYESTAMLIQEVACWNRALSDSEILTLAAS